VLWPQTFIAGTTIVLDSASALYTALAASLRPYVQARMTGAGQPRATDGQPLTVTAACSGQRMALAVKVLTGAAGAGATANNGATSAAITPQASGSRVYGTAYCYGGHPTADDYYDPLATTEMINDARNC
jgi:hypothetical protein